MVQQSLRLVQIRRLKPLSKPRVHRRQQGGGCLALTLGLPQAGQAGGGAEFPGSGLLLTGNIEGLVETDFRLGRIWHCLLQQQGPLEPRERMAAQAAIVREFMERYYPEAHQSARGAADLAVPAEPGEWEALRISPVDFAMV